MSTQRQPSWHRGSDPPGDPSDDDRSRFVSLTLGLHVEVTDLPAVLAALTALDGPPEDELVERLRNIPANAVGQLFGQLVRPWDLVRDIPGVRLRSSWSSAGSDPDGGPVPS